MRLTHLMMAWAIVIAAAPSARAQVVPFVERLVLSATRTKADDASRIFSSQGDDALKRMAAKFGASASDAAQHERRFDRLPGASPTLRTDFRALPHAEQRLVVELGEASHTVLRQPPSGQGVAILRELDVEGLALSRTHGDFVLNEAIWLRSDDVLDAIQSAPLTAEQRAAVARTLELAVEPATIQADHVIPLWRAAIRKGGDGAKGFWKRWVLPHKGKWLMGGALAAYLAMPEVFHDAAGRLTEAGVQRIREIGINAAAEVVEAANAGIISRITHQYETNPTGTIWRLAAVAGVLLLAIPVVRRFLRAWFWRIWMLRRRRPAVQRPFDHTPFQE